MKRKLLTLVLGATGMMALILDGQTALDGAAAGMNLCLKTVVPALFPFLFLCSILVSSLWGSSLVWLRPLTQVLGIPEGAEALLVAALLGGYPAGAEQIGQAFQQRKLRHQDAAHLLHFCSNAGPAFLFGITALQFPGLSWIWALWGIHILSSLLTGRLFAASAPSAVCLSGKTRTIAQILTDCVKTTGVICGWILLFQVLLGFLDRWFFWLFPDSIQVLLMGLLELSSGCCALERIANTGLRFVLCSVLLSFGGLCVTMQTNAVLGKLSIRPYLLGKTVQTILSLVFSLLWLRLGWAVFWGFLLLLPLKMKKEVDFSSFPVYNACIMPRRKRPCFFAKKLNDPAPTVSTAPIWRKARSSAPKRDCGLKRINASVFDMIL